MEPFRTEIAAPIFPFKIDHKSRLFLMGSCFAENMGNLLTAQKFHSHINPFGILFNPFSVVNALERMLNERPYHAEDLLPRDEFWVSLDHHGRFSHRSTHETLAAINTALHSGAEFLKKSTVVFITLGSAWVYRTKADHHIVANCHKLPSSVFEKHLLSFQDVHLILRQIPMFLQSHKIEAEIVFTVSPVRHLKDGAIENQRSKSTLISAVHAIVDEFQQCHYFPAYEYQMDDLRDYRFYATDMIHPSPQAVDYIWQKFQASFFTEDCRSMCREINTLLDSAQHRAIDPESNSYQRFVKKQLELIASLEMNYPELDFSLERAVFESKRI